MNSQINKAMDAALSNYGRYESIQTADFSAGLSEVFNLAAPFLDQVEALDKHFEDNPKFIALQEVFFDLLMINFFAEDVQKLEADYLDSKEWEDIEEQTLDRGTELLNVLLYLKECQDEYIEPALEDFLKEFLLVEEDEFQDEYRIYEDVIANQILVESSVEEIASVNAKLSEDSEFKELFYPVINFFRNTAPGTKDWELFLKNSTDQPFDAAIYALLVEFNKA